MKKKVLMMLPCIAAIAIATFIGKKTFESHAYETNNLLIQNVEALSQSSDYVDNTVRVRYARAGYCWKCNTNYSDCPIESHGESCKIYTIAWNKDHDLYNCMTITADRYKNGPGSWTLCETQDNQCQGHKSNNKPKDEQGHTY